MSIVAAFNKSAAAKNSTFNMEAVRLSGQCVRLAIWVSRVQVPLTTTWVCF